MLIKATQKYTRQAPRKVRLVANAIKGLPVEKAIEQLGLLERKASMVVLKVLSQALANARNNYGIQAADLKIDSITVSVGPSYKRFQAVSRGRAHSILKRTCHVCVSLISTRQPLTDSAKNKVVSEKSPSVLKKAAKLDKNVEKTQTGEITPKLALIDQKKTSPAKASASRSNQVKPTKVLRHTTHK